MKSVDSSTHFNLAESFLLWALLFIIDVSVVILDVIIDLARDPGENPLLDDFILIGGLSDVGVDSAELLIGDKDGTCVGFMLRVFGGFTVNEFGGGDGVIDLDSVNLVYLSPNADK